MNFDILGTLLNLPGSQFLHLQIGNGRLSLECLAPVPHHVYSQAQGVVKDLEPELLRHLAQGTASLLITTKGSPRGELRGQVGRRCVPLVGAQGWAGTVCSCLTHLLSLSGIVVSHFLAGWRMKPGKVHK